MYRAFGRGAFFFAVFSKNLAKKFIFGAIFATNQGDDLRVFLIANRSEYAPDSLGARGVANPGASFFDCEGNFSRQKCARMSARSARDSIMRPPRHQSRESSEARGLLPASASIVESRKPLARLNVPSASPGMTTPASRASCRSLRPLTGSTTPKPHPLEYSTTTASQIRSRSSTADQKPRDYLDLSSFT